MLLENDTGTKYFSEATDAKSCFFCLDLLKCSGQFPIFATKKYLNLQKLKVELLNE